jgi:peptidoglycan/xylan/chitin deacetylase (PgdA/CDA1 family)
MAGRILKERKQQWILGISFCAMTSMALINFTVTGSVIPLPQEHVITYTEEAPAVQLEVPAVQHAAVESQLPQPPSQQQTELKPEPAVAKVQPPVVYKPIALTFDDGPDETYTPLILDILKKNAVKATFFVVGIQASRNPQILKRIHEEGHAIGNHSWDHADLSKLSVERINQEIKDTDALIEKTVGIKPTMVRAPYGAVSDKLRKILVKSGRPLIGWNIDPRDWAGTSSADMLQNIQSRSKSGAVILLHSFGGKNGKLDNTVEALPNIIAYLKQDGYQMVTIPELNELH